MKRVAPYPLNGASFATLGQCKRGTNKSLFVSEKWNAGLSRI